jgi:hypothetical protein
MEKCPKCGSRVGAFDLISQPGHIIYKCDNPLCKERWEMRKERRARSDGVKIPRLP